MASAGALKGLTPYFIYLLITASLGPLLFGYHLAELNAPMAVVTCSQKSIDWRLLKRTSGLPQCIPMNTLQLGFVVSFFTLGGLIGALAAGPITARQGRLRSMLIASLFAVAGPVLEALTPSIAILTLGRLLSGCGAGAATVIVPIYISEIAPPGQKGFFGSFTQVMINMGILAAQLLGLFLSRGQLWRIILAVGGAIALAQLVALVLGGEESPKWTADNGRPTQAKKVLQKLRGSHADIEAEFASWRTEANRNLEDEEETLLASQETSSPRDDSVATTRKQPLGAFAVLRHPDYWPAVFAVATVMVIQQATGINAIIMYGVSLLSSLLKSSAPLLNVIVAAVNIAVTVACAPLIDRLGRKTCLLLSMTGMGTSSVLLAIAIMNDISTLSAIAVICFVASFGLGLGPVPFILASELVSTEAVGATQSWALAANWTATFFVAQFFPYVNSRLGKGQVFFIFAGIAALSAAFTAWWVPETKGKADADEAWGRKKPQDRED